MGTRFGIAFLALSAATAAAQDGDPIAGERVFGKCTSCHQVGEGAKNRVGPHLDEIVGREAGSVEGFRYSRALQDAGLVWTPDMLDAFLENPRALVVGTRMSFRGLPDPQDRADVIAYLRQFTHETDAALSRTDPPVDATTLAIEGDRDYGEYLSGDCTTCHRLDGSDAGIPSITGWDVDHFVTVMHAYRSKHRDHPVMQTMAGRLADDEIAALAAYFATLN